MWPTINVTASPTPLDIAQRHLDLLPVNLVAMAHDLGAEVDYEATFDDPNVSGSIAKVRNNRSEFPYLIKVNGRDYELRKRFTLAHEIAHLILHQDQLDNDEVIDNEMYRSGLAADEEYAANRLAAELLMPRNAMRNLWRAGVRDLASLGQNFGASEAAVRIRLKQLGLAA